MKKKVGTGMQKVKGFILVDQLIQDMTEVIMRKTLVNISSIRTISVNEGLESFILFDDDIIYVKESLETLASLIVDAQ